MPNLVEINNVEKSYVKAGGKFSGSRVKILKGVTFTVEEGLCVGLIGESGSGKSTLSRLILGLEKPDKGKGSILIEGQAVPQWIKANQGKMSVVFQDYTSSVNPKYTIREIIAEPLHALGRKGSLDGEIDVLLAKVSLAPGLKGRYPHELSGGQLQRVCIARAISTNPRFLVLDEAISSLDVSVQTQAMNLLHKLRLEMNMTYLFVAHDLQVVAHLCNKIVFLYRGEIVEQLMSGNLVNAQNEYAKALLASVIPFET
ncbi:ABC transporter ATP-binding protein [Sporomusa acidovorans]|uniref:Metal-staphylopine import system ATP-binding protein CntF n=1 Tax=Sporomusa acidovorans (strain ATCC 49682 / DSM 3132 / Mol) TaxID=1123286 RepID=A0ABZ3J0L9_SPOA4|nr:ABC transporter ATP-binding protein [Sporomusa acidovorans]OZC22272.1 nickel import ATP-binding protein NikE [Sporomusa acidovorans DSM 3132]SDF34952.1 nickel transport system ATP-binding protein [Sporomusa acidovorans]